MNFKKTILTSVIALGALCGYAQQAEVTQYVFNPHWYGQLQVGGQETLGEGAFDKLLSPNAQIEIGYQINPLFGLRLGANAWQSKGIQEFRGVEGNWKWNYVAPALDLTFNLTNAFGGYNPNRKYDVNIFGGIGANVAWKNDEANAFNNKFKTAGYPAADNIAYPGNVLEYVWDGTKTRFLGRFGAAIDFAVSERVKLGAELSANIVNDKYNSKRADNSDWYFNGLVGIKYTFGPSYTKRVIPVEAPAPVETVTVQEKVVVVHDTVVVEQPAPAVVKPYVAPVVEEGIERNVFYLINSATIRPAEMQKVQEIADYMKSHPNSRVHVTGYADKGTGTLAINVRLARQRAQAVVTALTKKYGIAASRITMSSMTDHEYQPFEDPVQNRVAICVVE